MKKRNARWILLMGLMLSVIACGGTKVQDPVGQGAPERLSNLIFSVAGTQESRYTNPDWLEKTTTSVQPSSEVDVHLFIDGSYSMRGYLAYSDSLYKQMVTSIPSICINAFKGYDFNTYKVFDDVYTMKDTQNDFRPIGADYDDYVIDKGFYGSEMGVRSGEVRAADKTRADYSKVIERIDQINPGIKLGKGAGNDLYIIVSDFIPQNGDDMDFYCFNNKLYSELLSHDLCCGIAGFKSEFNGEVLCLDVQGKSTSFEYKERMPFYVMVIGETRNVTNFMDEMQGRIDHFELSDDTYGLFMTDGQSPKNPGSGDVAKVVWTSELLEGVVSEQDTELMVSSELLRSDVVLTYLNAYNIFPIDDYIGKDTIEGEIRFDLPFELSRASSIIINDMDWTIDYAAQVVHGQPAIDVKEIERLHENCEGVIDFPIDMSAEAFEYIYGIKRPKAKKGQDPLVLLDQAWNRQKQQYLAEFVPKNVSEDEMFIKFGEARIENGEVVIPIKVSIDMMRADMPYLVSVNFSASPKITTKPLDEWVNEWNMGYDSLESWVIEPTSFDEGKTPGLFSALKALQGNRIYDEGVFNRQVNIVLAKSEKLAPAKVKTRMLEQMEAQKTKTPEEETKETETEKQKSIGIFDIFKK